VVNFSRQFSVRIWNLFHIRLIDTDIVHVEVQTTRLDLIVIR